MPHLVRWSVVTVVMVVVASTAARLAAAKAPDATPCPDITMDQLDFVNKSDGCVKAHFDYRDKNVPSRIETTFHSDIFCINARCPAAFQHQLYSEGGGCVMPNDLLEKLEGIVYIFCGRFIDDEYTRMALTAVPTEYDKSLRNAIFNKYVSITELHPPSVEVQGAWQKNTLVTPHVYYVVEDTNVKLICNYEHGQHSKMRLQWSNQIKNFTSGGIVETQFMLPDSGIYECRARLKHEKYYDPFQLNITVIAKDATYLTTTILNPNVTELVEDHPVQWEIFFISHPEPVFQWRKQGKLLLDSNMKTSRDHFRNYEMEVTMEEASLSLFLHHPILADNGKYTLEASLPGTNITTTTTMFLLIPGKSQNVEIRSPNSNQMFKEGESFSVTCSAEGYPKPDLTLDFIPQSDTNLNNTEDDREYNQLQEERDLGEDDHNDPVKQSLHWTGVAEEPGWYQCKAENDLGRDYSSRQLFLVTDGESLLPISLELEVGGEVKGAAVQAITVVEGDDFTLTCRANKQSAEAPLAWTLNDTSLDQTAQENWSMEVTVSETRLSAVSRVRAARLHHSAGNFSMRCADQTGSHADLIISVQEMVEPAWRGERPARDYDKNKNDNLTLSCPADGTPRPKIIWKKGGEVVQGNNLRKMTNNYQLFFETLSSSDAGLYTCEVSNRAGVLSASFSVAVRDPDGQTTVLIGAIVGVLIVVVVVVVVVSVFLYKYMRNKKRSETSVNIRSDYLELLEPKSQEEERKNEE